MAKDKNDIDQDLIKDLADLLNETDLSEIEVEKGELRIRLTRQLSAQAVTIAAPAPAPAPAPAAAPAPSAPAAAPEASTSKPAGNVTSPMVGTAYLAAAPGEPPFVSVGDSVKAGDTVLIVEAMKTMNHIPAPKSGTVKRILVEDGATIEYGAPLVIIE